MADAARKPVVRTLADGSRVGLSGDAAAGSDLSCTLGLTKFDVGVKGNSNRGHSFEGDKGEDLPAGVIGPAFTEKQRADLLEYLKML